jgi:uncharacterized protein (TIGR00251 family)
MKAQGEAPGKLLLKIHLQPRAAHDRIVGRHGEMLKVQVHAPAVGGAANAALIGLLAETFSVPRRAVRIVRGETSRDKSVEVKGAARARLDQILGMADACIDKARGGD